MKNKNYVYVLTKNDDLELPMIVADTIEEISILSKIPYFILYRHCRNNRSIFNQYRIREIDIRDPEEKFVFEEYNNFCLKENLSPSHFKSLMRFRRECFGS